MVAASELPIDTGASAMEMADAMFGDGMTILKATYQGDKASSGIYSDGDEVAPDVTPSDTGVILSSGKAKDFTNSSGESNTSAGTSTNTSGIDGDPDMNAVAGFSTYDAALFKAVFIPEGDTLTMQFVFSSEEYLEYVGSGFNDAVGVWVNGVKAELTVGDGDVSINNINTTSNENLYVDNAGDQYNTEMDGFTITLTIKAPVIAGEENTIKIGIADAGDAVYDSNLLIAGNSIQSLALANDDEASVQADGETDIDVLANDTAPPGVILTITHINGIEVNPGDSVVLPSGEVITLNADGTLTAEADSDVGSNTFSYTVEDDIGNSDTAFVTLTTTVPCFVAGTRILTKQGPVAIEELKTGDQIVTQNGFQALRWVGCRHTRRNGSHAPVIIRKGALENTRELQVSPQHRIMLSGALAELWFDSPQVLVRAKDLVNDHTILRDTGNTPVAYFHLLFDTHQLVKANGQWSESFHPGEQVLSTMDASIRTEVLDLFPGLAQNSETGYGQTCLPCLQSYEAKMLVQQISQ